MSVVTSFGAALPPWLVTELPALPDVVPSAEERMALVNDLADRNWRAGNGGPFAALVVEAGSGEILSIGVNVVISSGLSAMHAEVVAIALAQQRLGSWDLGARGARRELVVNARPCVQCFGATLWSGVRSLVVGADGPEVEAATGFDEGPMVEDWVEQLSVRGIDVRIGLDADRSLEVLEAYGASGAAPYNARGTA